jgi:energy-converting hydrogenase Eha subunit C
MNNSIVLSVVRHLLSLAGGVLIAKGYLDSAEAEAAIGAISTGIALFLSIRAKVGAKKALDVALILPENSTHHQLEEVLKE